MPLSLSPSAEFHHAGVSTKTQRAQGFAGFVKVFASLEMDMRSTTAEADRVVVQTWPRCKTHSGLTYENEMLILIHCHNDKIVSSYEQLDPLRTLEFEKKLQSPTA